MTAPAPHLSPMAGLFNHLVRHLNRRYRSHIADLQKQLAPKRELNFTLRDRADYDASNAAGYIDTTGLERP